MSDTSRLLSEFRKAIRFLNKSQVVDLDVNFIEKFECVALHLEDVFRVNTTVPPNRWSFHRIGIITQGTGEFQTGIHKIAARKNTLVIVPARVMTSSRNWSPDVKGLLLLFNAEFLLRQSFSFNIVRNKKILSPFLNPHVHLNDEQALRIMLIFDSILKEQTEYRHHQSELIALKVLELVIECERLFQESGNLDRDVASNDVAAKFSRLLEQQFHVHHSVTYYATKLNIHPNYLNSLIKKSTGETVKRTIRTRLIIEIKYLLHSTTLSIKEIAARIGFDNPSYLTSFFQKEEKTSPAAYRQSLA